MPRNKLPEIWLVEDAMIFHDVKTGMAIPVYHYADDVRDAETVRQKNADGATLEQLVELCDQDAESVNAHDFVGAHRLLGAVLYRHVGRIRATAIMRTIAERRGLHGMNGVCGIHDSYKFLRVGKSGFDWSGSYGK